MSEPIARRCRCDAGDALLDPAMLLALGVLVLNDHVLKAAFPGIVTGKLSDVAGLMFFPTLLLSGWELALAAARRRFGPSLRVLVIAVAVTGLAFTLVKTVPQAAEAWGWALGAAQWLLASPFRLLAGTALPPLMAAPVVMDSTDLIALPALAVAAWVGLRRLDRPARGVDTATPVAATQPAH